MAATVIDKLVIELGIDVRKLTQGQKQAIEQMRGFQQEALRQAKQAEDQAHKFGQVVGQVRNQVLGLSAALIGATGVTEFIKNMVTGDAALGRIARSAGQSTQALGTMRNMATLLGGSTDSLTNFVTNLQGAFQQFKMTGEASFLPFFQAMGVDILDAERNLLPMDQILDRMNRRFQSMRPEQAAAWVRAVGGDQGMVNMLTAMREEFERARDASVAIGAATDEDVRKSQKLLATWNNISGAVTRAARDATYQGIEDFESGRAFGIGKGSILDKLLTSLGFNPTHIEDLPGPTRSENVSDVLRLKSGAAAHPAMLGTMLLARDLQKHIPGLNRFTALNDDFHGGQGAHGSGRALDFTLNDPSQSAATAEKIRQMLRGQGIDASVLDEYLHPSAGATAGHIHVQFNNDTAAQRYASQHTNIQNVNVYTQATDAHGIATDIRGAIDRAVRAATANTGQN